MSAPLVAIEHTVGMGRQTRAWIGYVPIAGVGIGAGAGAWFAFALGALETPFALVGAAGGYFLSGAILRRVYSRGE